MRTSIKAAEGKILTNGETYGKELFLAEGMEESSFYEITDAEYQQMLKEQEEKI